MEMRRKWKGKGKSKRKRNTVINLCKNKLKKISRMTKINNKMQSRKYKKKNKIKIIQKINSKFSKSKMKESIKKLTPMIRLSRL